jgi:lipopolysaccharide transport system ATP-binding protein
MIRLSGITKSYRLYKKPVHRLLEKITRKKMHEDFIALNNVILEIPNGMSLGIIGTNGSGKSTLLKIIRGVAIPDAGTIEISDHGRIAGLLELGTGFDMELSGRQNIFLNGALCGMSKEELEREKENIINFAELGTFIDEPMKTYSSGMLMRLGFSIAIHSNPSCFLIDEALSVGDAHFGAKCTKRIREFVANGGSVILVSHDLNAVKILCDQAILLKGGQIVDAGEPESVCQAYNRLIAMMDDPDSKNSQGLGVIYRNNGMNYGDSIIKIESVSCLGEASGTNRISCEETVNVCVEVSAAENVDDFTVGFLFRDKYGQDIYGSNTFHLEVPLAIKAGSVLRLNFRIPKFAIAPGSYSLTVAVHGADTHIERCHHWLDNCCELEVTNHGREYFVGLTTLRAEVEVVA